MVSNSINGIRTITLDQNDLRLSSHDKELPDIRLHVFKNTRVIIESDIVLIWITGQLRVLKNRYTCS